MIKQVFAVYDSKAEFYKNPFMMQSKGEAIRAFSDLASDVKTEVGLHPEDFCLFHLGTWDDGTGLYEMLPTKVSLGLAIELRKSNEEVGREALNNILPLGGK